MIGRVSTFDPRLDRGAFDAFASAYDFGSESVNMTFDGLGNTYYSVHVSRHGDVGMVLVKVTPEGKNLFYSPGEGWTPTLTQMIRSLIWGDIQADPTGRLYYAYAGIDSATNVYRLSADGKTVDVFDGTPHPRSMAMDARGNLYFLDPFGHQIRRLTAEGKLESVAGDGSAGSNDGRGSAARFASLSQMVIEPSGNLLVSESSRDDNEFYRLRRVTPTGEVTTLPTRLHVNGEWKPARIHVFGLAVDSRGTIYIAEPFSRVIYRGTEKAGLLDLSEWVGASGQTGYVEGTGSQARFGVPSEMVMAGCNRLLMFDDGNRVIRQIQ